jgi:hypothetical protein
MVVSLENIIRLMVSISPNIQKGQIKDDILHQKICFKELFSAKHHCLYATQAGRNKQRFISERHMVS